MRFLARLRLLVRAFLNLPTSWGSPFASRERWRAEGWLAAAADVREVFFLPLAGSFAVFFGGMVIWRILLY